MSGTEAAIRHRFLFIAPTPVCRLFFRSGMNYFFAMGRGGKGFFQCFTFSVAPAGKPGFDCLKGVLPNRGTLVKKGVKSDLKEGFPA
jgi:hypothetical protein